MYGIDNGDLEILVCFKYTRLSLIFTTPKEVICRLPERRWLDILCASLGLSCQVCSNGPKCICTQNISRTCSMLLLQGHTAFVSLGADGVECLTVVLSRRTPVLSNCEVEALMREGWRMGSRTHRRSYIVVFPENERHKSCWWQCFG